MKKVFSKPFKVALLVLAMGFGTSSFDAKAAGKEDSGVQEILGILRDRGIIEEEEYTRLATKNASYEKNSSGWLPKLTFSGDFRARYEYFHFAKDETGAKQNDRSRGRYRARIGIGAEINDYANVFFRLASGSDDPRSANQTMGDSLDFDSDPIRFDAAYVKFSPWKGGKVPGLEGAKLFLQAGKMDNPFFSKSGKYYMWDSDITPEGVSANFSTPVGEGVNLFANAGYFIFDENSSAKDPHVLGLQLGTQARVMDGVEIGGHAAYYRFSALNSAFVTRAYGMGNVVDGLTGEESGGSLNEVEAKLYGKYTGIANWPITVYGSVFKNLDAERSVMFPDAGREDLGWGVGIETGDAKKYVELGLGYGHFEANSFPSVFIDSSVTDGKTNRESLVFYMKRQVWANTVAGLTLFQSEAIEDSAGFRATKGGNSVAGAERTRVQADLEFKF